MANVPVRLSRYSDDRRFDQFKFSVRASVKRESRCRPTENRFADRTPLLLRRYFTDNNARFVSGRILKCKGVDHRPFRLSPQLRAP